MDRKQPGTPLEVVLLFGGKSAEHEVSIQSARNVAAALSPERYRVVPVYLTRDGEWYLVDPAVLHGMDGRYRSLDREALSGSRRVLPSPREGRLGLLDAADGRLLEQGGCVYPVLHGPLGEDGTVQGMLRLFSIPFVGAGVLGSAVGMDKDVMKRLLREAGVPTPRFMVVRRGEEQPSYHALAHSLGPRLFVKPANMGSSVGIRTADGQEALSRALDEAFGYDTKVLVEESVAGREIECSVLQDGEYPIASLPGEVVPGEDYYSYRAKYLDGGTELVIPADIPGPRRRAVQDLAVRAFQVLCCEAMARVDLFLPERGSPLVNEINTLPGFTPISMYPKLWEASGISTPELVDRLVGHALSRARRERGLLLE
ncbi:MAG: D-alanine--D-alanine ligase family protein [Spirochaetota bacterium]